MKKKAIGCAFLLLVTACIFYAVVSTANENSDAINRLDAGDVALSFTIALMENEETESLIIPELLTTIDEWKIKHTVFNCPTLISVVDSPSYGVGGSIEEGKARYTYGNEISCPGMNGRYRFSISGITLQKTSDGEWLVTGWDEICEMLPGDGKCKDPLN